MNLARTVIRRIVWILTGIAVYAVLGLLTGEAHASGQDNSCDAIAKQCSPQTAYAACLHTIEWYASLAPATRTNPRCELNGTDNPATDITGRWIGKTGANNGYNSSYWGQQCPTESTWNGATKTCFDSGQCLAKNQDAKQTNSIGGNAGEECIGGCAYKFISGQTVTISGGFTAKQGQMGFSGEACTVPPKDPPYDPNKDNDYCQQTLGQTVCVKSDGKHCYSLGDGVGRACWTPGETGEKGLGDNLQKRSPGETPQLPNPPPGDTLTQTTPTLTDTTTKGTTTITTNVTNYNTGTGADSGAGGGEDGAGGGGDGEEGPGNESSGGGTCESPPVSTGDGLFVQIAYQSWKVRCAIEDSWKGFTDSLDGAAGEDDGLTGVNESDIWAPEGQGQSANEGLFGGGSAGQVCSLGATLGGQPFEMPSEFWPMAAMIHWLMVALAYVWAAFLILR